MKTQEDKQLLLKDLCARLPYGVICHTEEGDGHLCSINQTIFGTEYGININSLKRDYFNDSETERQAIKPYLRPLSSMTVEEKKELSVRYVWKITSTKIRIRYHSEGYWDNDTECPTEEYLKLFDWFNEHHFDYRGLIDKGLAIEVTEENNPY